MRELVSSGAAELADCDDLALGSRDSVEAADVGKERKEDDISSSHPVPKGPSPNSDLHLGEQTSDFM